MDSKQVDFEGRSLTIQNYKEPLKEIPKGQGFGYYGVVLVSTDGDSIQCHICGELFSDSSAHIRQAHKITIPVYRERFGLARGTALISEKRREFLRQNMLDVIASFTPETYREMALKRKNNNGTGTQGVRISLETKNKRGTCPDQLLDKIKQVADKLGRTPTSKEFIIECGTQRYKHLIFKTFGSWNKAIEMLGMKQEPVRTTKGRPSRGNKRLYSDEELIEYLVIFAQENKRLPSGTDFKRGFLPDETTYMRAFGSIKSARAAARLDDVLADYGIEAKLQVAGARKKNY